MISRLRVLGLDVSDGRAAFSRATPARQEDALTLARPESWLR